MLGEDDKRNSCNLREEHLDFGSRKKSETWQGEKEAISPKRRERMNLSIREATPAAKIPHTSDAPAGKGKPAAGREFLPPAEEPEEHTGPNLSDA